MLPMTAEAQQAHFYVSVNGNDGWSGRLPQPNPGRTDGPFATLTKARDTLRLRRTQRSLHGAATVTVRGGNYVLTQPFVLAPEDSGSAEGPVIFEAAADETPVFSGGRRITGWHPAGERGLWVAELPDVREGAWYSHQLFVDGQRQQRSRSPNEGFFHVDGQISYPGNGQFRYRENDIHPNWGDSIGVEVIALCNWQQYRLPIATVNAESRSVTLTGPRIRNGGCRDMRYWVENAIEALDKPGEWYLDRRAGRMYYLPQPREDMQKAEVIASVLPQLVVFDGDAKAGRYVHDITLRGLTFEYADWTMGPEGSADIQAATDIEAAINARGARACSIERCVVKHSGEYAIAFGKGSKNNRITGNEMFDLGGGGVKLGDPKSNALEVPPGHEGERSDRCGVNYPNNDTETSSGAVISDNHIHDIGAVHSGAVGVWVGQSYGNTVSHNDIHDTYYSGISVGWTWGWGQTAAHDNLIEYNLIHNIGRGLLSDMGCIYTLGFQPGTVLRNNVCHDVRRYEHPTGYGGWGFYLDSASTGILVENNIVYRAQDGGFHNQYGQENTYRNNIFALGTRSQMMRAGSNNFSAKKASFYFDHNIIYWKEGMLLWGHWNKGEYHLDHNLYFRAHGEPIRFGTVQGPGSEQTEWNLSIEQWQQQRGQDQHSMIADPHFVNPDEGDFSLKSDSPAWRLGFHAIDVSQVGPRKTARRDAGSAP
jgi:hypothetical protein